MVATHPFTIQPIDHADKALPLGGEENLLEAAVGVDFREGNVGGVAHTHGWATHIEFAERLPNPVEVASKNRLSGQSLGLNPSDTLDFLEPFLVLDNGLARPIEVGD